MVRYFRRLGNDAYLIASVYHDGRETISENSIGEKEYILTEDEELGIPIIRVGSFTSKYPPRRVLFKDSIHTLERIVNDYKLNVLITHSTLWNGPEDVAKFVEWRRNIKAFGGYQDPLIFCHMSHFQEPSPSRYSLIERSFRVAWNKVSLQTILRVANLILVVTPYEEKAKVELGASPQKCILFPGGVDDYTFLNFASSNPAEVVRQWPIPRDAKIIAYIGTMEERKNPKAVLDVAEKLVHRRDIHFVLAGKGDSEYASAVKKRAATLPNVTYLGEISEKQKVQLIEISYLNILLSRMEALGLTQLEFMFRGVPVITSGIGGQSWIVENGKEGIHVKGADDTKGAARAIVELVDDSAKHNKLSINAKRKAGPFTLTKLTQDLNSSISKEMEKETGLICLPSEVRATLEEPEVVIQTYSHGTRKVVATNKRLFIQSGRLSRNTIEIPYSQITSIRHSRQYSWKTLIVGTILSMLIFTQHYVSPIISRTITSRVTSTLANIAPLLRMELPAILSLIWVLPVFVAVIMFLTTGRSGYILEGATQKPVYLPRPFKDAVMFIRSMQKGNQSTMNVTDSLTEPAAE
jgi:glycosyltransferase involved in cell wall biosynthesis